MDGQQSRRTRQSYQNGYCVLLALVVLSPVVLGGGIPSLAYAAGSGDLLKDVPVVDENTLNNAACGIAAATMILDYYLPQSGPVHEAIDITAVARYVKEDYWYDAKTNTKKLGGTTYDELQTGIEAASTAPELGIGVPLTASWQTTDSSHWFSVLTSQLDAKRPVILFLADGGTLGWNWHYGHFIVVSGYTGDNSIIYHDPWDGKPHVLSKDAFATVWGTIWKRNSAWQYMTVSPSQVLVPTPTPPPTTIYIGLLSYDQLLPFYPVDYDSSTAGGTIFALNINNGSNRWYHTFDGNINSVAVFEGIAYMSENGNIYMFDISDGTLLRHFKVGYFIDPPVVVNGVIYVHAINRTGTLSESVFYALNNDGSQIWSYRTGPVGNTSSGETPVVVNKVLYVSTEDGGVYALNTNNGSLLWHTQLDSSDGSANLSSPKVLNGIVYVAGYSSGHLYALNADTGSLVWRSQYNSVEGIASLTASDGVLYISNDVSIYALRASDGNQLWHKQTDGHRNLLTAVGGVVYVSSSFPTNPNSDGSVTYAFRASDGFMLWRTQTQAQAHQASRVPEVVNGIVYVASDYRTGHNIDALHASDGTLIWESSIF